MGLDMIEIALDIEDRFDIRIPDGFWSEVHTVGDVFEGVLKLLAETHPSQPIDRERVWQTLVKIHVEQLAVKPYEVTPESRYIEDLGCT